MRPVEATQGNKGRTGQVEPRQTARLVGCRVNTAQDSLVAQVSIAESRAVELVGYGACVRQANFI